MRKFAYIFAFVLALAGCQFLFADKSQVFAEELTSVNSETFSTEIVNNSTGNYVLTENIALTTWTPINFLGSLDGNGFTITTPSSLFSSLSGATISNLGIIATEDFVFDTTGSPSSNSNFGLLAQNMDSSVIDSVFAVGEFSINVAESTFTGGLIGYADKGLIKNSYVNTEINLIQYSSVATKTIVGGLIGNANGTSVYNCYATPINAVLLNVEVDRTLRLADTNLVLGGLIGLATKTSNNEIINNFTGGAVNYSYNLSGKTIYLGNIFGQVNNFSAETMSNNHTFNAQDGVNFIGNSNNTYTSAEFYTLTKDKFASITTFAMNFQYNNKNVWFENDYEWNLDTIWCKNSTYSFPCLQVFQTFEIKIDENYNSEGIIVSVQIPDAENVGEYITTDTTSFKFGENVRILLEIEETYIPYKNVFSLNLIGKTLTIPFTYSEPKTAYYDFVVSGSTSGTFYGTTSNVEYSLIVKTKNNATGLIKVGTQNSGTVVEQYDCKIEYGKEYSFIATPKNSSYAFSEWTWIKSDGSEVSAIRGSVSAETLLSASKNMNLVFGKTGVDSSLTYLSLPADETLYTVDGETGDISFTLQAVFSDRVCSLEIKTNLSVESCSIKVGGVELQNIVDWQSVFNNTIQIDRPVEIIIVMKEGFTFNKWATGDNDYPITHYIYTGETETSTTINLTISNDFILYLNVSENSDEGTDLTWLWITLASVGGAGLVGLVIALIIVKRKKESFINYY